MSNVISSALFCGRNVNKATTQGRIGRAYVAIGQGANVFDHVRTLDNAFGKSAKTAVDALKTAAKSEKLIEYAGKAVDFASKNINPLLCASAGLDILMSEDKGEALVTNTTALTSMFAVEHLMKKYLDDVVKIKGIDKIAKRVMNFAKKYKHGKSRQYFMV